MLSFIKFLKILLPVATVTSATIATTFLVSSSRDDLLNKEKEEDSKLTDFVNLVEDFKEKTMFYSKKGDGDGTVALSEEESEKLQKLIDEGADINKLGNRSNNVPDAAGGPSQAINMPAQGAESSKGESASKDSLDSGPSAEAQTNLRGEENSEANGSLDSSVKLNSPDGGEGGNDNESEGSVSTISSEENSGQQGQLSTEPDVAKSEGGGPAKSTQDEQGLEVKPQGNSESDSNQIQENLQEMIDKKDLSETKSNTQIVSQEGGDSVSESRQNSVDPESDDQALRESYGESEQQQQQQQDKGDGDSSGSSDENRFDLATLQKWQDELGSAKDSLNEILSRL